MEFLNFIRKYMVKNMQNLNPHVMTKNIGNINYSNI